MRLGQNILCINHTEDNIEILSLFHHWGYHAIEWGKRLVFKKPIINRGLHVKNVLLLAIPTTHNFTSENILCYFIHR